MAKKQRDRRLKSETLNTILMPLFEEKLEENLGNRLRELRRQQSFSLRALAEKSGLSANTLSLIENGKTSPSVATLHQIALALSIPITAFFELGKKADPVIYTKKEDRHASPFAYGTIVELGSGVGKEGLQPHITTFVPHAKSGPEPLAYEGTTFIYCLAGRLVMNMRGQEYVLDPGDSLLYQARIPHSWENPLDEETVVLATMAMIEDTAHSVPIRYPVL